MHVLHFLEHKILRYALKYSWLASKQWWDSYLCLSQKVQIRQSKTCYFKIKTKWSNTINISHTTWKAYRKIKSKSSRRLIERIKVSLDRPLVFVRAQESWKGVQVQGMCTRMEWMLKWEEKLIWEVFISMRQLEAGKFPLGTQQKHQPLDLPHAVERGEQEVVRI